MVCNLVIFPNSYSWLFYGSDNTEAVQSYNRFTWFLGMYMMGAYISMYEIPSWIKTLRNRISFFSVSLMLLLLYIYACEWKGLILWKSAVYFWPTNSIVEVVLSISIFLIFEKISIQSNRVINYIASCTLGIYMLHDGELASMWWNQVFRNSSHQESRFFLVHIMIAVIIVIFAGVVSDTVWKIVNKILDTVQLKFGHVSVSQKRKKFFMDRELTK